MNLRQGLYVYIIIYKIYICKNAKKAEYAVQFQNSCKKRAELQKKKAENAFQFENSCQKRAKMEKRKHIYLDFCSLLYPLCIFLHFKPKNSYKKKDKNAKKKQTNFFKLQK